MTAEEAIQIRAYLLDIARERPSAQSVPDVSNEVVKRLTEQAADQKELSVIDRVESALDYLSNAAFAPTRDDFYRSVELLASVCMRPPFDDVQYVDPITDRVVSMMDSLQPLRPGEAVLRQAVNASRRVVENEFVRWRPSDGPFGVDAGPGSDNKA